MLISSIVHFRTWDSCWFYCNVSSALSSSSRPWFSSILQSKQLQDNVHRGLFSLHGPFCSTIFQWISVDIWAWSCSYQINCGMYISPQTLPFTIAICDYYGSLYTEFVLVLILQFNNIVQVIFSSPATVAIIVAYFLDFTLSRGHSSTRRDSGRHWWEKFRTFNKDIRSEEFYSL